jgi:hypothetical protein
VLDLSNQRSLNHLSYHHQFSVPSLCFLVPHFRLLAYCLEGINRYLCRYCRKRSLSSASNGVSLNSYLMQITNGGFSPGIGRFCATQGIMTRNVFPLQRSGDVCCRHLQDEWSQKSVQGPRCLMLALVLFIYFKICPAVKPSCSFQTRIVKLWDCLQQWVSLCGML